MNDCGAHKIAVKQLLGDREQKIQHYCPVATTRKEAVVSALYHYYSVAIYANRKW
jgi:hypothetical protein